MLFITIPIVLHSIGTSAYAIYALVSVVLGFVAFLDFGITAAVVRSVSTHRAVGDLGAMSRVIGTALTLLTGLGILGAICIVIIGPMAIRSVLHVPPNLRPDAVFAFQVAALGFGCNMLLVTFAAAVQGLQRLDIMASRTVFLSTLTSAAQITAVSLGGGLRGLVLATIVVSVLSFLPFFVAARRLLPAVSFRPRFDREAIRELAGFGLFRFVNQASGHVTFQFDPIVIGIFQPIAAVAYYAVPLSITQKFHVVEDSVAGAYFPATVDLYSRGEMERLRRLYLTALKVVLVAMTFLVIICAGYAHPILSAWVGRDVADNASNIFVLLAVGYGVSAVFGIPSQAADAMGYQRWTAGFAVASAIIQLGLALLLVPRYGPIGAAEALIINVFTQGMFFMLFVQRRFLKVPLRVVAGAAVARPALVALTLAIFVLIARDLARSTITLAIELVAASLLFVAFTFIFRVWSSQEIRVVGEIWRGLWDARPTRRRRSERL